MPENTALAYRSRWRSFEAWCAAAGRVALPATAQTVAAYLTHLATERGLKATSVDAHLTAIRAVHRGSGAVPPDGLTARKIVVAAQRREAARDGRYGPRKAVAVMASTSPSIVAAGDPATATGLRDRAVVLLGFALLARRSELAALNLSDVELVPHEGLAVTIRSSKTDQSARGMVRRIHYASNELVCPVRAVLAWTSFLAARGVTAGPLFSRVDRWGNLGPAVGGRLLGRAGRQRGGTGETGETGDGRLRPQAIGAIVRGAVARRLGLGDLPPRSPRDRFRRRQLRRMKQPGREQRPVQAATASAGAARRRCSRRARSRWTSGSRHGRWSDSLPLASPATSRRRLGTSATPTPPPGACCSSSHALAALA